MNYLNTVNFSGANPGNITATLEATTAWERDEDVVEAKLIASPTSWLRFWGGAATADQEVSIVPAAAEIVVPGGQGGTFERSIDRVSAGADLDFGFLTLAADYANDDADAAVVRTDYLERERLRFRAGVKLGSWLRLLATDETIDLSNPTPGIDYDGQIDHVSADLELIPTAAVQLHGGYDSYQSDSTVMIRQPHDFQLLPSLYVEDGENVEASLAVQYGRFAFEAGGNRYSNEGDLPFDLDRTWASVDFTVKAGLGVRAQFERREYSEALLAVAAYDADRYGIFVRWASK